MGLAGAAVAATAVGAVGSIATGVMSAGASKDAAKAQADANTNAANMTYSMYQQTAKRLQPWVDTGTTANAALGGFLGLPGMTYDGGPGGYSTGAGVKQFQPTMAQLEQTPGYQFTRDQGIQATTNAAAAMGLGKSGSTLKGIDSYTTGLASQTYQQQFNNYWSQLGNVYNMLTGASGQGLNAAAQTGQAGTSAASTAGSFTANAGANTASGIIGGQAGLNQAVTGASSLGGLPFQYQQGMMMQNALNRNTSGQYAATAPTMSGFQMAPLG